MADAADGADDSPAGLSSLTPAQRDQALARWQVLRAHLEDACPLVRVAGQHGRPERTLRRWLAAYRAGGLAALARRPRSDRGTRRMPPELQLLIEGLALRRPPPAIATMHRQAAQVARDQGWPVPGYAAVYDVARSIDTAMATLAHEGSKRYKEVFDLVHRREAAKPSCWQPWRAGHRPRWSMPSPTWDASKARNGIGGRAPPRTGSQPGPRSSPPSAATPPSMACPVAPWPTATASTAGQYCRPCNRRSLPRASHCHRASPGLSPSRT